MAVTIRLMRAGAKHRPFFKVVVTDSRMPRDGRFIAILGTYDPLADSGSVNIDLERVKTWMGKGAKPSLTVSQLLKRAGMTPEKPVVVKKAPQAVSLDELRTSSAEPFAEPAVERAPEAVAAEAPAAGKKKASKPAKKAPKRKANKEAAK
ncbi:MAG: 30S ribosomal protein S16 [Candidatus Eisenbacteria bacterium]|nr:30S ribosomal protein S16 [Candidatus Eisenbacteria bacterium]